jgi:hypothetical protein
MRYIKKFNESFDSDNEIDKFLIEIKDDCAEISDKFTVFYNWETYPNLDDYINLFKEEKFTKDKLSFYVTIFKDEDIQKDLENWNNRDIALENPNKALDKKLELLDYEMDFFKRIKHLIETSNLYLCGEELDHDGSVTLVADFIRN